MTRYTYSRLTLHPVAYLVRYTSVYTVTIRGGPNGEVWREGNDRRWHARIYSDPTPEGTGRTRDDAVDDVLEQIGGLG